MAGIGNNTRSTGCAKRWWREVCLQVTEVPATERFLIDYLWTLESVPVTQIPLKYKNHPGPELGGHQCLLAAIPREKIRPSALEE